MTEHPASTEMNMDESVRNYVATAQRDELEAAVARLWRLEDAARGLLREADLPSPDPEVMDGRINVLREAVDD